MERIRLTGLPTGASGEIKRRQDFYPNGPGEIMNNPFIMEAMNMDDFARLLYYPQRYEKTISDGFGGTKNVPVELATTLMVETTGGHWETIGHVYGVSDPELEKQGLELWKKDDYIVPEPKIEIPVYRKRPEPLNEWAERQGMEPFVRLKIPSRKKRKGIRV